MEPSRRQRSDVSGDHDDDGAESVCYLSLTCAECGAMEEGADTEHLSWCSVLTSNDRDHAPSGEEPDGD